MTEMIEQIKSALINSCINYNPKEFLPYLLSDNVKTGMPNKIRFYKFFKYMLNCTRHNSKGRLTFKIKHIQINEFNKIYYLNFYDKIHKHSQLTFEVKETKNQIYFDTLPF